MTWVHGIVVEDGTRIAGRVEGHGPPLVLVHGQAGDGDLDWDPLLPHLTDRFTCYRPSTRGRGLSGHHPDLSPERRVQDLVAFIDSIGGPVAVVGESAGGVLALGAAARTSAIGSVVAYEPPAAEAQAEHGSKWFDELLARLAVAVDEGRMVEGMRTFVESVTSPEELAAMHAADYLEAAASYAPLLLAELLLETQPGAFSATDRSVLARIAVPLLLLHGTSSALAGSADAVHHVAAHVDGAEVRGIAGAGHAGPLLEPRAVAAEVTGFLADTLARRWGEPNTDRHPSREDAP